MKIKEIENQTGITSHNIRFYEKERLLAPGRNPVNGYREYTESDVELLKRIKLLRMLDIPVADIRECLDGGKNLTDVLHAHLDRLKGEEKRIRQNYLLCQQLAGMEPGMDDLGPELLEQIFQDKEAYVARLERVRRQDRTRAFLFFSGQLAGFVAGCWRWWRACGFTQSWGTPI